MTTWTKSCGIVLEPAPIGNPRAMVPAGGSFMSASRVPASVGSYLALTDRPRDKGHPGPSQCRSGHR